MKHKPSMMNEENKKDILTPGDEADINSKAKRVASLMQKPLRPNGGTPMIGKNAAKPMKMPQGRIMTKQAKVSFSKPLRGLK